MKRFLLISRLVNSLTDLFTVWAVIYIQHFIKIKLHVFVFFIFQAYLKLMIMVEHHLIL